MGSAGRGRADIPSHQQETFMTEFDFTRLEYVYVRMEHNEIKLKVLDVKFNTIEDLLHDPNNCWLMNINIESIGCIDLFPEQRAMINNGESWGRWFTNEQDPNIYVMNGDQLIVAIP
jgi:hypothetical protein